MALFTDFLNAEKLYSRDNPLLKATEAGHRMLFESLDNAARLNIAFAVDLLDLNRERFQSFYGGASLKATLEAQRDLALEMGQRTVRHAGELAEVIAATALDLTNAANEQRNTAGRSKKSKAA